MYRKAGLLPVDVMYSTPYTDPQSPSEHTMTSQKHLTEAFDTVRQTCKTQHERQKEQYDIKAHNRKALVCW